MEENLDRLVAGIRAKRNKKLPQAKERLANLEDAKKAVENAHARAMTLAASHPEMRAKLDSVGYDMALSRLNEAIKAGKQSVDRLSRTSINIGVAGKARQGKSQILQMLTGLGDKQIPTGDGGYCTGARSEIRNAEANRATIYFKEEADLMEKIILPACRSLSVSPCPGSVSAFMNLNLSAQPKDPEKVNDWNNLDELQRDLKNNRKLLDYLGSGPIEVGFDDLRRYVTKDEGDREFQIVDHVDVETRFDSGLPAGMLVFDLPGLRDPAPGVRDAMLKSIKEKSDIVFLMRRPDEHGDDWGDDDIKINKDLHAIYAEDGIEPKDWLLLVMNHVRDHEKQDENGRVVFVKGNEKNLDEMLDKVAYRFPGFHAVKCDCGSKEAVRNMVNENVEVLIQQTSRIDDLRIRQADDSYNAAMSAVRSLADAFAAAIGDTIAQSGEFDLDDHIEDFWAKLRKPFKMPVTRQLEGMQEQFKNALKTAFGAAYTKMKKIYESCESVPGAEFPSTFPVFTKTRLVRLLEGENGPAGVVERAARNQLSAVVEFLRDELHGCCEELRSIYLRNVAQSVTKENKALQELLCSVPENERGTPEALFAILKRRFEEGAGSVETIVSALDNLLQFDVSYETQLLPYLFDVPEFSDKFDPYDVDNDIDKLGPYLKKEFACDFDGQANVLFNALKNYSLNWIAPLANAHSEGPCQEVSKGVMRIAMANYRNFIALFVWGEKTEVEWEGYLKINAATLWPKDFEEASSKFEVGRQLRDIIATLRKAAV